MKNVMQKLTKAIVTVGVACLLLGIVGYSQPARGTVEYTGLTPHEGQVYVVVGGTDHFSHGNWIYSSAMWANANTRDGWGSQYVPFGMYWGWSAWVLYSLYNGWSEEVTFLYDVDY